MNTNHVNPPEYECVACHTDVIVRKGKTSANTEINVFECVCTQREEGGRKPINWNIKPGSGWFASTPAGPPADPSKCTKCGKDLTFVGLNRTYPPKRDDMGRAICPHCAEVQPEPRGL